ncbi:ABC transporter substrate-binding protein [Parafrankia discariae]|uniref:ABC transporter substrate-binding protein n=1 Tax=Parafrankia discariae TaxID=365528 RepID=UPI0003671E45|nr:ABC transporter substrate-binding protein [Parafrankia discariae]
MIVAAGLASCSPGSSAESPRAACVSPGVTSDQVKLGLVYSESGMGSSAIASARSGVDARIGLVNAEGGIHGRKVVYEWRDDTNIPAQSATVTEELLREEGVFGLVTVTTALGNSLESLAAQKVPVVGFGLQSWAEYPNLFADMYEASPETVGRYVQANGGRKVGILTTGTPASTVGAVTWYRSAFQSIGLASTDAISYARGGDSPARVVRELTAAGADSLIGFTTPEDIADVVRAAREANLRLATVVSFTGYDSEVLPVLGRELAGVSFPVYFRPFETGGAALDRYRTAMTRYAPETVKPDQQFALHAYVYTDMFLRGLDLAGDCPTREGFIGALRKVTSYDAGGLIEPVNLAANSTQPLTCYAFVQINPTGTAFQITNAHLCADGTAG